MDDKRIVFAAAAAVVSLAAAYCWFGHNKGSKNHDDALSHKEKEPVQNQSHQCNAEEEQTARMPVGTPTFLQFGNRASELHPNKPRECQPKKRVEQQERMVLEEENLKQQTSEGEHVVQKEFSQAMQGPAQGLPSHSRQPVPEPTQETVAQETAVQAAVQETAVQETEAQETAVQETEAQETEAQEAEAQGTEAQEAEAQGTEAQGTEAQGTEAQGTEAQEAEAQGTAAQGTAVQETAVQETATQETVTQETATQETVTQETEAQETESQETEAQETEAQETEAQETEAQETVTQETEAQETEAQETVTQETESQETESQETESQETESQETVTQETESQETEAQETVTQETESQETATPELTPHQQLTTKPIDEPAQEKGPVQDSNQPVMATKLLKQAEVELALAPKVVKQKQEKFVQTSELKPQIKDKQPAIDAFPLTNSVRTQQDPVSKSSRSVAQTRSTSSTKQQAWHHVCMAWDD